MKGNSKYTTVQLREFINSIDRGDTRKNREVVDYHRSFIDSSSKYTNCSGCIKRYIRELKEVLVLAQS